MIFDVVFAPKATDTLLLFTSALQEQWGKKIADQFLDKTYRTIEIVSGQPYIFKESAMQKNVRHGIVNKYVSFLYQVNSKHIVILYFWDNRQEPLF